MTGSGIGKPCSSFGWVPCTASGVSLGVGKTAKNKETTKADKKRHLNGEAMLNELVSR